MTPATFMEALSRRCGGAYRVRWSEPTHTWMIEQKVSRATEVPTGGDPDVTTRVQDGYALVLQVSPTHTLKCPQCFRMVPLPILKIAEVKCDFCHAQNPEVYDNMIWFTGYFPFCDKLIEHLERTAPKREGKWLKEMGERNAAIAAAEDRRFANHAEAVAGDYWKQVAGIPTFGYGHGPASHGRL